MGSDVEGRGCRLTEVVWEFGRADSRKAQKIEYPILQQRFYFHSEILLEVVKRIHLRQGHTIILNIPSLAVRCV
jgi:hypothetical protein